MRKVKIITDSTSDLTSDMLMERGIDMVPLHITLGDNTYADDKSLSSTDLFDYADAQNTLPKSSAANEYQFHETFAKWLEQDFDIFFIGISSKLSATVQNAAAAAQAFDSSRISVVDSYSLSTGVGLQALEAADLADSGASLEEITTHAHSIRDKVQASFVVDTLKYLYMGGRCSRLASIFGSRLKIKPKLELIDGEIVPTEKFRGSSFVNKYVAQVMSNPDGIDQKRIFVTHCLSPQADDVKKQLIEKYGFNNVIVTDASPTISTHCGPGTIGVLYIRK
jgi:DegV family protein with EDD domain